MTPLLAPRPRSDRAFERIYRRHVGDVYRYALAVMRNPADAEDVTQTTFLNAYRSFVEKGNRPEKPQNWLIAIAHNVCRQRFRQSARRPSEVSFEDDIADSIVDDETPTGEDIRRALSHLAFNQRAALVMRELEGRSYAEIAEILDLSTSAVETLIFRGRRALREQLEGSLTCGAAELAISRQLDGRLTRPDKAQLRAHLRECAECASFARRQRAQRSALKSLGLIPVPSSLLSLFGDGGGAAVGTGLAIKAAAAVTAGIAIGGAGYEGVRRSPWLDKQPVAASSNAPEQRSAAPRAAALVVPASPEDARATKPAQTKAHDAAAKTPPGQAKKASGATGKGTHRLHPTGKGHQKTRYAGDAGVAARHVKVRHVPARVHPAPPPQSHRKAQRKSAIKLPGPFDTKPPAGKKSK
jgi:RNA polymerase sigma factor (sigma-70 family)